MTELKIFFESFSPLKPATWKKVQTLFTPVEIRKGDYFAREGEICHEFAFLRKGIVRAFYRTIDGKEYNKHFFVPPSIIGGYTSLTTGRPNQTLQEALTDCDVVKAYYPDMIKLYDQYPDLERVGRLFAERYFVEKERKEAEIILYDADERYRIFQHRYPDLEQRISQYHIASYLGITPTQLSRIRKKLSGR